MFNLWRAEWLKLYKRPVNQVIICLIAAIYLYFFASTIIMAKIYGGSYLKDAEFYFSFPRNLEFSLFFITRSVIILTIIFIANNLGSEYGQDTWKILLPRCKNRLYFMLVKISAIYVWLFLLVGGSLILSFIFVGLSSLILGTPFKTAPTQPGSDIMAWKNLVIYLMMASFFGGMTFLSVIISRSVIGGIIGGIVSTLFLADGERVSYKWLARCMPTAHITNIEAHWKPNQEMLTILVGAFGYEIPVYVSILVVIGYMVFLFGISTYLFQRRDIAG